MTTYLMLKHVHMTAAATSGLLFLLRGLLMINGSRVYQTKLLRILPHVIDTVLLASAVWLALLWGGFPLWMQAKVGALLVYIGLGLVAMRFGRSRNTRTIAFVFALLVFSYILSVAVTKSPFGFFGPFV